MTDRQNWLDAAQRYDAARKAASTSTFKSADAQTVERQFDAAEEELRAFLGGDEGTAARTLLLSSGRLVSIAEDSESKKNDIVNYYFDAAGFHRQNVSKSLSMPAHAEEIDVPTVLRAWVDLGQLTSSYRMSQNPAHLLLHLRAQLGLIASMAPA